MPVSAGWRRRWCAGATTMIKGERVLVRPAAGIAFRARGAAWLKAPAAIGVWLLLWWLLVRALHVSPDFLPSPEAVLTRLATLSRTTVGEGALWLHVGWSLWRFTLGFVLAVLVGVTLGFLMGYFRPVDYAVSPLFELMRYVPPIAWAPFAILWFGASLGSQAFVIFISALPPVLINAYKGIRLVDHRSSPCRVIAGPSGRIAEHGIRRIEPGHRRARSATVRMERAPRLSSGQSPCASARQPSWPHLASQAQSGRTVCREPTVPPPHLPAPNRRSPT